MKHAEHRNFQMSDESVMRTAIANRDPRFDGVFVCAANRIAYPAPTL